MALTENEKRADKREKPMTKVVVRRLPPSMDQATFLNQVSPVPEYNYIYTARGDSSLGEFAFTRVYLNFTNPSDIYDFKERFDGYIFLDSRGHEYPGVVEFAPFQKIPKKRGKTRVDPKCGTVESDPVFQEFLDSLNKPKEQEEKPEYTLQLTSESKNDVTTPLLEFIKNKRAQKLRIREVRREERKRRDFDKKKERYDERKKIPDERSASKVILSNASSSKVETIKEEKNDVNNTTSVVGEKVEKTYEKPCYKSKEKKYDERRYEDKRRDIKPRYPKKEYYDNRDSRRQEEYREREQRHKYDDYKKEEKTFTKKVKKYSERREERKMEAQKLEHKSDVKENKNSPKESNEKTPNNTTDSNANKASAAKVKENEERKDENSECQNKKQHSDPKSKETDSQYQKRIRNKDRPTIAIYRPGMLSKRKQNEEKDSPESKDFKQNEQK